MDNFVYSFSLFLTNIIQPLLFVPEWSHRHLNSKVVILYKKI